MYDLLLVAKIAAMDKKVDELLTKEKIWNFIFQMDSSLTHITLASKLPSDDCLAFMDLIEILLLEHPHRVVEYGGSEQLLQLGLYFLFHSSWEVCRVTSTVVKHLHFSRSRFSKEFLVEFHEWLPILGECLSLAKTSDAENAKTVPYQ